MSSEIEILTAQMAELRALYASTFPAPPPAPTTTTKASPPSELESQLAAALVRGYGTDPAVATATARAAIRRNHVFRDTNGAIAFSATGAAAFAKLAPLPQGDSDAQKVARAMHRERMLAGKLPTAEELDAEPTTPTLVPGELIAEPRSDADRVHNAMIREAALKAQFGDE